MNARIASWLELAACGAVLTACSGRKPAGADSSTTAARDGDFKVALLTPGPVSDQSWNGGAYDGLLRIRDSLGAKISNIQTATPADFEENFRQYGAQGYQLVFGHGFEFQDAAKRVAPQFPHTIYITTSGTTSGPNLAGMTFGFADASYLAGMLAASMTKTDKLGALGGTALPPVVESFRAFEQGAKSRRSHSSLRASTSSFRTPTPRVSACSKRRVSTRTRGSSGRTPTRTASRPM